MRKIWAGLMTGVAITIAGCTIDIPTEPAVSATASAGPLAGSSVVSGLVAHYPLDGDAVDATGNGLDGVVEGNPTWVADRFGNGLLRELDGFLQRPPPSPRRTEETPKPAEERVRKTGCLPTA